MNLPDYFLVELRNVKHARLRVNEDGTVKLFAPVSFSEEDIQNLLDKKADWIESKRRFFKEKEKIPLQRNELLFLGNRYSYFFSSEYKNKVIVNNNSNTIQARRDLLDATVQERWLKVEAKKLIRKRTTDLSERLLLPYNKLYIRSQKRKWGNCSAQKNVSINWRIIKAPPFVIDYVIVHELCHTLVMKHTARFQTLLKSHYPDCEQARMWLDKYGNSL